MINEIAKIQKSFPELPIGFYEVFKERIKENGFSDSRLIDAVNYVIDNCHYPTPTIAQFISFDKKIKLYNYEQYRELVEDGANGESYKPIKFKDRPLPVWIHINDITQYNIKNT